jgi:hypothetical protein
MRSTTRSDDRPVDHLLGRADQVAAGLLDRTLPKPEWTHDGHLLACISLVRRHGAVEALRVLRGAIPPYNVATGVANTPTGGYHDTITVYYVWAIDRLLARGLTTEEILAHSIVERTAAFAHWDRDVLMSPAARAAWMPPQRAADDGSLPVEVV